MRPMNAMSDSASLNWASMFDQNLKDHQTIMGRLESLYPEFEILARLCVGALQSGKKLLWFGNGGSASDAQHLATELVVRLHRNRPALRALALTTDTSTLTAIGNDFGFESLFSRQIEAMGQPGDVAIGITTSGRSPNVVQGLAYARNNGLLTAALTGETGGDLVNQVDVIVRVPSSVTMRIQEAHIWIGHTLCAALEDALYGHADVLPR